MKIKAKFNSVGPLFSIGLALAPPGAAGVEPCHIHPPADFQAQGQWTKPEFFQSLAACEAANAQLFGGQGRCHCGLDGPYGWRIPFRSSPPGSPSPKASEGLP